MRKRRTTARNWVMGSAYEGGCGKDPDERQEEGGAGSEARTFQPQQE
jgi:hypothetical protein